MGNRVDKMNKSHTGPERFCFSLGTQKKTLVEKPKTTSKTMDPGDDEDHIDLFNPFGPNSTFYQTQQEDIPTQPFSQPQSPVSDNYGLDDGVGALAGEIIEQYSGDAVDILNAQLAQCRAALIRQNSRINKLDDELLRCELERKTRGARLVALGETVAPYGILPTIPY